MGCHFLLQGIFPTWGSNPGLPHCGQALYCLSHQGIPFTQYFQVNIRIFRLSTIMLEASNQTFCIHCYLLIILKESESEVAQSCPTLRPHGLQPSRLFHPWDFPDKNTGVGCHFLFQELFPTQGLNLDLPHCRQTLYRLSHQGSPNNLETSYFYLDSVHNKQWCLNYAICIIYWVLVFKLWQNYF